MSYLVLARKYRPQRFSELVGQEHVARTLANAITQNRVHHAFLFTGARGVGKTSAARILAKALACEKGPTAEPCGVCDLCQEIAGGRSVDVIEIDAASNTKVEETKSVLEGVRYLPARARRKVYIIDEVHMLSAHSFNALLKTLEEPPPHVVFVFATTEVHKIPVTILSRCQRFDFKLISTARLTAHLQGVLEAEKIDAAPEAVRLVARQAAGSVRDGLSLLDQAIAYVGTERLTAEVTAEVLGIADRRMLVELAGAVLDRDAAAALRLVARAADRGVDLAELGRSFLGFLRDLEVVARVKSGGTVDSSRNPQKGSEPPAMRSVEQSSTSRDALADLVDATAEELDEIRALAGRAAPGLGPVLFDRWARAVDEASRAATPRLLYEMAAVDLCAAEPLVPLGDLLERLEDLELRLRSGGQASGPKSPAPAAPARGSWGKPPAASPAPSRPPERAAPANGSSPSAVPPSAVPPSAAMAASAVPSASAAVSGSATPPASAAVSGSATPPASAAPPASAPADAAPVVLADDPPVLVSPADASLDPAETWRRVLTSIESKSMRLGALLAHAAVASFAAGTVTLAFPDKRNADSAEKDRALIETALSSVLGRAGRVAFTVGARPDAAVRSAVARETDADLADRKVRETEARQHPVIRRAQDVFGAPLKEIKT